VGRFSTAQKEVFTISNFRLSQLTLLNQFQQKPSPFELIAFAGKLDQDRELIVTV
jgi:hypothetical protein